MSRHRSQASSSSNEAYSTVSEYSGDLLPTTPISPGDMANYAYYENYGPTPYLDPDGFEDNNYYCSNDGQVADYYDQADSNGYAMSSGLETTPGIYQNPT